MKASSRRSEGPPDVPHLSLLTTLIATGLFTGYIPWASGTFGSLLGCAILLVPAFSDPLFSLVIILAGFALGVVTSARVAAARGGRLTRSAAATKALFQSGTHGEPDPSIVVIDEVVGMWVALFMIPVSLPATVASFVLFRLFDVVKPPPARQVEAVGGGWGIMLDDVVAGIYANLGTRLLLLILPSLMNP